MGDPGSVPGLGRSPGEGKGYPLQYSALENFKDSLVHGVAKSWTWLSDSHNDKKEHSIEKMIKRHYQLWHLSKEDMTANKHMKRHLISTSLGNGKFKQYDING